MENQELAPKRQPVVEAPPPPPEPEPQVDAPEQVQEPPKPNADPEVNMGEEKPKARGGFQRKIDKQHRQIGELKEMVAALQSQVTKTAPAPAPVTDPEPEPGSFETYEKYVKAQARWEARQEIRASKETESKAKNDEKFKSTFEAYSKRADEARDRYEDFDDVVSGDMEIPQGATLAILKMTNGPDVAYHLGKNPDLLEQIREMDDIDAAGEIRVLSDKLKSQAPKRVVTKAPAPISPLGGGSTESNLDPGSMTLTQYRAWREKNARR